MTTATAAPGIAPKTTRNTPIMLATAGRALRQLQHDHRTVAMLIGVPILLLTLIYYMFRGEQQVFDRIAPIMIGIFPFTIMFLVTSIAMLRERTSGTLERLMTTATRPIDLLGGYGLAFGLAAAIQALVVVAAGYWFFGLQAPAGVGPLIGIAVLTALLGVGLGLLCSAFARTEFQAVQMLPIVVIPQILLCGLFVARASMTAVLTGISDVLPLSYAVQAMQEATSHTAATGLLWRDLAILAGYVILTLGLAAATMRRQTK